MREKKKAIKVFMTTLVVIILINMSLHFAFFGTGISGFYEKGISGFSIGKTQIGEDINNIDNPISPFSKFAIVMEWTLLILALIFIHLRNKREMKEELTNIKIPEKKGLEKSTQLDTLYHLLQEKKHIHISTISKVFKIDKEMAMAWAKTLESGNLAFINYSSFKEPELILNE